MHITGTQWEPIVIGAILLFITKADLLRLQNSFSDAVKKCKGERNKHF
jgi:hypothetical protein